MPGDARAALVMAVRPPIWSQVSGNSHSNSPCASLRPISMTQTGVPTVSQKLKPYILNKSRTIYEYSRGGNGTSKPVPVRRGQMRAPGARLRSVPLPARESPTPHASSAHTQRKSISGACSLPSRTLVLARPGLTWMRRRLVSCRKSSTFTVVG